MLVLQRAQASALRGFHRSMLLYRTTCRRHRVAHRTIHRPQPCEVNWITEVLSTEDLVDDVLGESREDRFLHVHRCVSIASAAARAFLPARLAAPLGGDLEGVSMAVGVVVCAPLCVAARASWHPRKSALRVVAFLAVSSCQKFDKTLHPNFTFCQKFTQSGWPRAPVHRLSIAD